MPKYLTTENWVVRFREAHGEQYDYSRVDTKGQNDPVVIICPSHGEFKKTPVAHGRDRKPCPDCARDADQSRRGDEFISRFIAMHGSKFDYSKVQFRGVTNPIVVICPSHGEFSVTPANHLRSASGCRKCGHIEKLGTTSDRSRLTPIERFLKRHGDKYDYSLVQYRGNQSKVTVICPNHGEFTVSPVEHWKGSGCKQCNTKSIDQEECIRRFRAQHGDKFDYSKTVFVSQTVAVTVICPEHGGFSVQPVNHWKTRSGCKGCAADNRRLKSSMEVVSRFVLVHGNAYKYDKFIYNDMHSLSTITCKKHGDFAMSPANHLSDHGCPSCWQNTVSKPETAWGEGISRITGWELLQSRKVKGVRSVIDFVCETSPYGRLVIEYDGQYWHGKPHSLSNDAEKTKKLVDAGFSVIRLRVEDGKGYLASLVPVPHAINIFVPEMPDDASLKLAVKEIIFALEETS